MIVASGIQVHGVNGVARNLDLASNWADFKSNAPHFYFYFSGCTITPINHLKKQNKMKQLMLEIGTPFWLWKGLDRHDYNLMNNN